MKYNRIKVVLVVSVSIAFTLIFLGAWGSGARGRAATESTVEAVNMEVARRVIDEVWNGENPGNVSDLYAPLFRWHSAAGPITFSYRPETWISGPGSQLQAIRHSFPDLQVTVEKIIVTGDTAAVCYSVRGTFTEVLNVERLGGSSSIRPSGEAEVWDGVFMYRFEDGKIADEWWYWDTEFEAIMQK